MVANGRVKQRVINSPLASGLANSPKSHTLDNPLPKLRTFRLFKKSFAPSEYLNEGPSHFRPAAIRFRCSNHRLDIELGHHNGIPRSDWKCRFCSRDVIGDEYHAFKCIVFIDLQVFCGINASSKLHFINMMTEFKPSTQRYITLLMSRIKSS